MFGISKIVVVVGALALFTGSAAPHGGAPQRSAADEIVCEYCNYTGQTHSHTFTGDACSEGGGCKDCKDNPANHVGCHDDDGPGECSTHAACPGGGGTELPCEPNCESALQRAIAQSDARSLATLIAANSAGVVLSSERSAVFIKDCRGGIASFLPMTRSLFVATTAMVEHAVAEGASSER